LRYPRCLAIVVCLFLVASFSTPAVDAAITKMQDLPADLQAHLKTRALKQATWTGLRLSPDGKSFDYRAGSGGFTSVLPRDPKTGIEVADAQSEYPIRMIPQITGLGDAQRIGEEIVFLGPHGLSLHYAFKKNGLKEDIVFQRPPNTESELAFALDLDPSLEVTQDGKGNVLVYGPDSVLSGQIETGDAKSAELILNARRRAPKNHLLYVIPAPTVADADGQMHPNRARYSLRSRTLILHVDRIDDLAAPVSIDPSVVVSTTADFQLGNDEGMISFDTDAISRGVQSAGRLGAWTSTTSLPEGRFRHASVAYNGFLYVLGGYNGSFYLNAVTYAPIHPDGTLGAFSATTFFGTGRNAHTANVYNGYLYVLGGHNGSYLNSVEYAKINPDGTVGAWSTANSFTTPRYGHASVAYDGYLYVLGGTSGSLLSDVQYAPFRGDGSLGAWTETSAFSGGARWGHTAVAYNGYLHVIGGQGPSSAYLSDVQFAPINPDGSISANSWTATSSFATGRNEHASVVLGGYLYVIGGSDGVNYRDDAQFAPINANGTLGPWRTTAALASGRAQLSYAAYNGRIYIVGGDNSAGGYLSDVQVVAPEANGTLGAWNTESNTFATARFGAASVAYNGYLYILGGNFESDVQYAPIAADGTIGTWNTTSGFSGGRRSHAAAAHNGYMYILGGYGASYFNDVQYAPINSDGTLGTWNATSSFTQARMGHTAVAHNGYLYIVGGHYTTTYFNDVQYALLNSDGSVGTWSATTSLAVSRSDHTSMVYNGYLYVMGGWTSPGGTSNAVLYAQLNNNGTVGTWTSTTNLATGIYSAAASVYNGYVYVVGGNIAGATPVDTVQYAPVHADGSVGPWDQTSPFTTARRFHATAAANGFLYILGGQTASNGLLGDVQSAPIHTNGTTGVWGTAASFPTNRGDHASVAYNGFLYVLGGISSGYLDDVQFAPIRTDGTLGTWTATSSFTPTRFRHTAVALNGYLYVIGGFNGSYLADVQYAPIHADGTLGSFSTTASLSHARNAHASVVYNGIIYVFGGHDGVAHLDSIEYATPSADGSIGAWSTSTRTLPIARYGMGLAAYNGYIYILGGNSIVGNMDDVWFTEIQSDGTIGLWTLTTMFHTARSFHQAFAYNGFLYVTCGDNGTYLKDTQFAPISSNGKLGPWQHTARVPIGRYGAGIGVYKGWVYVTGGKRDGGAYSAVVYYAGINGPQARALYSRLFDLGADSGLGQIVFNGPGTRGAVNLSYAVATSGAPDFGARTTVSAAVPSTAYSLPSGCARYVRTSFDLDDTYAATISDSWSTGRRDVLDFSISYAGCDQMPLDYQSHTLADSCVSGGAGNGNGLLDPGESAVLQVTVQNIGTETATNVSAVLSTSTPGVTVVENRASFPNIAVGALGTTIEPHFLFAVAPGVVCGTVIDFTIDFASDQGPYSDTFTVDVIGTQPVPLLSEGFTGGIPASWTIVNGGSGPKTWTTVTGLILNPPFEGLFAVADSFVSPDEQLDEQLITPSVNASTCDFLTLSFNSAFCRLVWGTTADVDISTNGGGSWTNVLRMKSNDGCNTPYASKNIDLTSLAAGQSSVLARFHYWGALNDRWWAIDNLEFTGHVYSSSGCVSCTPSTPGEATSLQWGNSTTINWSAAASAAWYNVYRGTVAGLPDLLNGNADSCKRWSGAGLTTGSVLSDNPPAGELWWYLVTAANPAGEGTAGDASGGPRTLDSTGACP
jgi:N-acetylneuraminic acid mutarotase